MYRLARNALTGAAMMIAACAANAKGIEENPSALGFDPAALEKLDQRIGEEIVKGAFPGAITMIMRDDKIAHFNIQGKLAPNGPEMREDAIFRIYSMTKPVTSILALMLVEEGRLDLSHPVSAYLPEYAQLQVAAESGTEAAKRPMTVQDLFLHTSGLTYNFFGVGPARDAMTQAGVGEEDLSNREFARKLASLPLEHHPGDVWEYSFSTDVLGAVIEVVEGKTLGEAMKERIFDPLGMIDTAFYVDDAESHERIAEPYENDRAIGGPMNFFDPRQKYEFESGGGGLVSTVHDYARFLRMMLNNGELDGVRILNPTTIKWLSADHLEPRNIQTGKYDLKGAGYGFGLGFAVRTDAGAPIIGTVGELNWGGAGGTYFWIDPSNELIVLSMMQSPKSRVEMRLILRNLVYGAFIE
jgi:CubicO group peptidase (beta-lactamase class C family)